MERGRGLAAAIGLPILVLLGVGSATARVHEVQDAAPFDGQVVKPDLSDEGLDGRVRVKVRIPPRLRRLLKRGNDFGEPPAVSLLRQDFAAVPFGVRYHPRAGVLAILPGLPLPEGQYTVTLDAALLGRPGRSGKPPAGFSTSFTVGPDTYPPVVRDTSPAPNQTETPLFTPLTVTFNESLDPASVVLGKTVFVEATGPGPPIPVGGTLELRCDGFDLVFVPDPLVGHPPGSTVRVRLSGADVGDAIADRTGNRLAGDYSFDFHTKGN